MNAAEIKLELFRKIDRLPTEELEILFNNISTFINASSKYKLSDDERKGIDIALEESAKGNVFSSESVVEEAKQKYPGLKFE
ncbi:MAG TPA: hypothetical protein P5210_06545 [Draconibacterium sp.]|nr:hypothetical protein [Draconibacterium sp.]HRX11285.1 hypothetical protein [Draconibacterium sp.]